MKSESSTLYIAPFDTQVNCPDCKHTSLTVLGHLGELTLFNITYATFFCAFLLLAPASALTTR